ncbi:MAG: hypothetical protein AAFW00_28220 [Bacteroidota bacterium]
MLNQVQTLFLTLKYQFRTDGILKQYFWVFLASLGMAWLLLSYNAYMSLHFYSTLFEEFFGIHSPFLVRFIAIFLALTIYFFISAWIGSLLRFFMKEKNNGELFLFTALTVALLALITLDVYANLQGVEKVSHLTTTTTPESQSEATFIRLQKEISTKDSLLTQLITCQIQGYCCRGRLTNAGIAFQQTLSADLAILRSQQTIFTQEARKSYQELQTDSQKAVARKVITHTGIIWAAYPMTLVLCLIIQLYKYRVLADTTSQQSQSSPSVTPVAIPCSFASYDTDTTPDPDTAYLTKWREAVELILNGKTNKEVIELYNGPEGQIRGTTIQKLKTVLRAKGRLPIYHN